MRRAKRLMVALLLALAGAWPALADLPAPGAQLAPDAATLTARIADAEAKRARIEAEVAGLGAERAEANARLHARARTLYRLSRSGVAPVAGGFVAMLEHSSRVERMKRLVEAELAAAEQLRTRGEVLRGEAIALAAQVTRDKTALASLGAVEAQATEEGRMAEMFDAAFAKGRPAPEGTGTLHTEYGTLRVHGEDSARPSFESERGQLTLPLAGAREIREAQREDGMGVEFVASAGAGVRAAADGTVAFAGKHSAYGLLVIVDHGDRYFTVYGGLGDLSVQEGDFVSRGARLGHTAGDTLYVEVRRGTKSLDARAWLGV